MFRQALFSQLSKFDNLGIGTFDAILHCINDNLNKGTYMKKHQLLMLLIQNKAMLESAVKELDDRRVCELLTQRALLKDSLVDILSSTIDSLSSQLKQHKLDQMNQLTKGYKNVD